MNIPNSGPSQDSKEQTHEGYRPIIITYWVVVIELIIAKLSIVHDQLKQLFHDVARRSKEPHGHSLFRETCNTQFHCLYQ